ncbi:hypothetical protein AB1Y20_010726 [Prymnesium parvum]|uniref:Uncharacterized protein n=1 Tax=Prymnesium parvum TaxID=97485 RepID=A0AB34IQC5_PRYPA
MACWEHVQDDQRCRAVKEGNKGCLPIPPQSQFMRGAVPSGRPFYVRFLPPHITLSHAAADQRLSEDGGVRLRLLLADARPTAVRQSYVMSDTRGGGRGCSGWGAIANPSCARASVRSARPNGDGARTNGGAAERSSAASAPGGGRRRRGRRSPPARTAASAGKVVASPPSALPRLAMSVLGLESCCHTLQLLRPTRYATEGLKQDLRDEVEFRQARLTAQGNKLRASIDMYGRDATACLRDGREPLARQLVSQKVAMQNRLAHISTHWGVLESVRASLHPGARRCLEDVETCRLIMAKAQLSGDVVVRVPGEEDVDGVDEADVEAQMVKLRELASKQPGVAVFRRTVYGHEEAPTQGVESAAADMKSALLVELHSSSDGGSEGDSAASSEEQILCTGEGLSASSPEGSPPGTPPRPASPTSEPYASLGRKDD